MNQTTTEPLLAVENLAFAYGKKQIFSQLSFQVNYGEIVCIMGPNGCGKTTLLDNILAIHKPNAGEIFITGQPIGQYKRNEIAQQIAYVPQIHQITFPYTMKEVVMMGRTAYTGIFSEPKAEDEAICLEALAKVGMADFAERPYSRLSGGEIQMVLLARALGQKTKLILMDEPTAHLDFKNELVFLETVTELVKTEGIAILMATHAPAHAFYFEAKGAPTQTLLMSKGQIVAAGAPSAIITEAAVQQVYGVAAKIDTVLDEQNQEMRTITLFHSIKGGRS